MNVALYCASGVAVVALALRATRFSRAIAIALLALPLLFTGRALWSGGVYGPVDLAFTYEPLASVASRAGAGPVVNPSISDVYTQFMPWNDALRRSIASHEWPLWNPYELSGTPLAGAAQSSPYHPITLLGLLLPSGQSFAFAASMMLLLAAVGAFLLFREFTSEMAALFGAAAWMCSTHLIFFAGTALVLAAAVTPLVLFGARRVALAPGTKSVGILTIALLLVVLAGHPESALHIVSFGVAYFLFELVRSERRRAAVLHGLAAGLLALLLSAIFLLPIFEVISQSEEYVHRALGYRQTPATAAQMLHRFSANFFPFIEGRAGLEEQHHENGVGHGWLATAYAGSLLFAPAAFALVRSPRRERWFFCGAILFGLAAGISAPGVTQLLSHLPGFSIAVNDRMIAFAALGMCALAAMGIDCRGATLAKIAIAIAAILTIVAIGTSSAVSPDYIRVNAARAVLPLLLAASALIALRPRHAVIACIGLLLLQRAGETAALQPTLPGSAFYPAFPGLSLMRADEPFRIVAIGDFLPPETSTHYGLEDIRGFQATTFARLQSTYPLWCVTRPVWSNRVDRLDSPILSLMNTRFAIVPPAVELPPSWVARAKFATYSIAENTRVLPRAFVPQSVRVVQSPQESLQTISQIADFGAQSVVEDKSPHDYAQNGPGVAELRGSGSHQRLRVTMQSPGWVIVSNARWQGWNAWERGRRIPTRFANHAFTAIHLNAGVHDIELRYRPKPFIAGAWISGVTAVLLLAYALIPSSAITFFMSFHTSFLADGVRRRYAG